MKNHLFVFACLMLVGLISCEKIDDAEEALVDSQDSQIQRLKVMQAKGQSIRFWYDNQGMVVHSEEADSFGYRYTYAKRDYVYELDKSRIISRNLYLYQYQIETNDVDRLDYRDTLFLNKQKNRVDSIHRYLDMGWQDIDKTTKQYFRFLFLYDEGGRLIEVKRKSKLSEYGGWSNWYSEGTLTWEDGDIVEFIQQNKTKKKYEYSDLKNHLILDARTDLVYNDWAALLPYWFGVSPKHLQKSSDYDDTHTNFSYQFQEGRVISAAVTSKTSYQSLVGIIYYLWE